MAKEILAKEPAAAEIEAEADRLAEAGLAGVGYTDAELERCARLTWKINRLKEETRTVIPAHVYQRPEVLLGVSDFKGDSYKLAKDCASVDAERIVFCGVRFMAETAKVLNPGKAVVLPAPEAGCSLADSITGDDVRRLKAENPGLPVVSYINTSVDVKAESDVIVTSANAKKILTKLFEEHPRIVFLPDEWMGRNLARELGKEPGRDMVIWKGKCVVHEEFDPAAVDYYRRMYPGVKILAHSECSPALTKVVDMVGGTGDMMRFVAESDASSYMLVTECGLGDYARSAHPGKRFVPMCRLCPYMKMTDLGHVLQSMTRPAPGAVVEVDPAVAARARRSIERMFELAE